MGLLDGQLVALSRVGCVVVGDLLGLPVGDDVGTLVVGLTVG